MWDQVTASPTGHPEELSFSFCVARQFLLIIGAVASNDKQLKQELGFTCTLSLSVVTEHFEARATAYSLLLNV